VGVTDVAPGISYKYCALPSREDVVEKPRRYENSSEKFTNTRKIRCRQG
jgi:hypothetical protein